MTDKNFLGGRLRVFSILYKDYMQRYVEEYDISFNQYFYLHMINTSPGINQSYFVEIYRAKKSLVSITLKDLESKGLITQTIDPNNRRSYIIDITPKGKEVLINLNAYDKICEEKIEKIKECSDREILDNINKIVDFLFDDDLTVEDFSI